MPDRRDSAKAQPVASVRAATEAAYWTEQWLRHGSGGLDPFGPRPVDYRARDRAEMAIARTPHHPPQGEVRAQVRARRAAAVARRGELDEQLRDLFEQRRRLGDRIERCSLALRGLGYQFDGRRGRYRGLPRLAWLEDRDDRDDRDDLIDRPAPSVAVSSRMDSAPPSDELSGAALRQRAEMILRVAEVPLTPAELVELLALEGVSVSGRPSQTLTNALRVSMARGDVERTGRARYRWIPTRVAA